MLNKLSVFLTFFLLIASSVYATSPKQPNSVVLDQNSIQTIIEKANNGDANAQFCLGLMYEEGEGIPQDYNEAIKWYIKAAEQGNANAQFYLGGMYAGGKGVRKDNKETFKWWTKAAELANGSRPNILSRHKYRTRL
jgi:TPR repeat protein